MDDAQINPFDDKRLSFVVLVNSRAQFALWPDFSADPKGWRRVFGPGPRLQCMQYVDDHWIDMRPRAEAGG
ncbi:MAG TPA: MbtH family protein [Methylosinus sp.]|jgi:MbtH protein|uniref:MbtH family protein n=1 Tax=Methylosinus sp. TaxID=427 RepID=UPI002F93CA97